MLMENFLWSKKYWTVVISGITEPSTGVVLTNRQKTELKGLRLKDLKAKNYLFQAIDRSFIGRKGHHSTKSKNQPISLSMDVAGIVITSLNVKLI